MRLLFNILAISGSAMFAGVLLAIGVILGGYWKSLSATGFLESFSDILPFIGLVVPVVMVPTLVGLAGSLWLSRGEGVTWTLWLLAGACIAALLGVTAAWFGPTNAQFVVRSVPLDQVPAKLATWLMLHNLRIALAAVASVLGVIATRG